MLDFQPATIILDVDGTLLDSPPCDDDYAEWERRILAEPCMPVPGAVEGVAALLARYPAATVQIITARSERLLCATYHALEAHYPQRVAGAYHCHAEGRARKLLELAYLLADGPALILDDDPAIADWIRPVDRLWLAPACWAELVAAPVAA